jgi:squalene synthase HpnC
MALYPQIQALVRGAKENFPVASVLLPKTARRPILHFYSFARNADDIADSPLLPSHEKTALLSHLQQAVHDGNALAAPPWAQDYIADTKNHVHDPKHGIDLLRAFLQDATKTRYLTFAELLEYCRYSAAPVGRVVLESSNETHANLVAADALCTALQLINHMQDCQDDYQQLNRIYLPKDWMQEYGVSESDLDNTLSSPALRQLFVRYLDECRQLLNTASALPSTVHSPRLRLELLLILELAHALVKKLSYADPLQKAVKLAHWRWPVYLIRSVCRL